MPKHAARPFVDAEAMTPTERLDRLVEILTRGVLRLVEEQSLASRARRDPTAQGNAAAPPHERREERP